MSSPKKNWKKRVGIICATLFVLYTLWGFVAMPLLLRYVGLRMANKQLAGTVSIEAIRVNPFSCSLLLRGIEAKTPEGEAVFSAGRFYGNFAFWSLFGKGWRFQEVHLGQPMLNVAVDGKGQLNLLQMLKPKEPSQAQEPQEGVASAEPQQDAASAEPEPLVLPLIKVDRLWLEDGGFDLSLALPGGELRREGRDINLELTDFSSDPQNANPYAFVAQTANGESLKVDGQLRLNPLSTRGTVGVEAVELDDLDFFTADTIGLTVDSGYVNFSFDYLFSPVSEPRGLFVENGRLTVSEVAIAAREEPEPFARLGAFEMAGFGVDLLEGRVRLGSIRIADASLRVVRDKQGVLNLIRYLFPEDRQREIVELVQAELAAGPRLAGDIRLGVVSDNQDIGVALTSAWHQVQELLAVKLLVSADQVVAENNTLQLRDEFPSEPVDYSFSAIGLQASDVRNFGTEPFPFAVELRAGATDGNSPTEGRVTAQGSVAPDAEDQFDFSGTAEGVDIAPFAPYLAQFTSARLASAQVSASGSGTAGLVKAALPRIAATASGSLDNLRIDDPTAAEPVLAVERVELNGVKLGTEPIAFNAELLRITRPTLRVVRNSEGRINLLRLVPMLEQRFAPAAGATAPEATAANTQADADAVAAGAGTTPATGTATPATVVDAQVIVVEAPAADRDTVVAADGTALSAADWQTLMVANAIEAAKHSQAAEALKTVELENISLRRLEIVDGMLVLQDDAVIPPVAFGIRNANLAVDNIILKDGERTTFTLDARFSDGASGVVAAVAGELLIADPFKAVKLDITTSDITLGSFGGYSDPLVGRPLEKGTVGTRLSYTITDGKLQGRNAITMEKVGFAPRREGSTGPRLPLELGMAILSDRNGVMRLNVPVSGDLNDPKFDLTEVIRYAFVNVLERLITAPFAVLGSLLGSGSEDGQGPATSVVFAAGMAEIPAAQTAGLGQLAHALYERPTLALQLRPVTNNVEDLQVLRERLLEQRIQAYAEQHKLTQERATERLYEQLLTALTAMDPQSRSGIEAMIAQASERAARIAQAEQAARAAQLANVAVPEPVIEETALVVPEPVVEGGAGAALQTVNVRSVVRSRRGTGFLATTEPVQVLVPSAAAGSALAGATSGDTAAASATGESAVAAAADAAGNAAAEAAYAASAADAAGASAGQTDATAVATADAASAATVATVSAKPANAEPLLEDKRKILLSQTVVTQAAVQELAKARTDAVASALAADAEHPLAAERISAGEPWQPQPQVPEQTAVPGVYFELGALEGSASAN